MRRYLETLSRFWHLALVPILVLPVGAFFLMKSPPVTYGSANLLVTPASLQQLSYVDQGLPPAQNMANYLSQLLVSPSFDYGVAQRTPLYAQWLSQGLLGAATPARIKLLAAADLSTHASVTAVGTILVTVSYSSKDPAVAAQVVRSILKEAAYETARFNDQQTSKDITYYSGQLKNAQAAYTTAVTNLGTYMSSQGIKSSQLAVDQLSDPKLAGLYQAVQTAQSSLTNAQQQLAKVQSQSNSQAALRVLDPPTAQIVLTSKKKELTSLAIPLVLGLLLSGAFIVIATLRDHTLRSSDDVADLVGLPVLAVIPHSRALAASRRAGDLEAATVAGEG